MRNDIDYRYFNKEYISPIKDFALYRKDARS